MAKQCDGLVFGRLPFFYAGAAMTGRGTVQMSIRTGANYLKQLSDSLFNQGFRRQIYVTTAETGFMTIGNVVLDVFDDIKCPVAFMNLEQLIDVANKNNPEVSLTKDRKDLHTMGDYNILLQGGKKVGNVGFYYEDAQDHYGYMKGGVSDEEWKARLDCGKHMIEKLVDALDLERYLRSLHNLDTITNTLIRSRYAGNLPKNKFGEWKERKDNDKTRAAEQIKCK